MYKNLFFATKKKNVFRARLCALKPRHPTRVSIARSILLFPPLSAPFLYDILFIFPLFSLLGVSETAVEVAVHWRYSASSSSGLADNSRCGL